MRFDRTARIRILGALALALAFAPLRPLPAHAKEGSRPYLMGLPWESAVVRGIDRQDRDRRRLQGTGFDSMVRQHATLARRDPSLANLYLLGRGNALRYVWRRDRIKSETNVLERTKHQRRAPRDYSDAVSAYRDVLKKEPRCYFAYHDLGMLELAREKPDRRRAFDYLVQALRINDRFVDARRKLILMYIEGKQYSEAIPLLVTLVRHEPNDRIARVQLINAYAKVGHFDVARSHLRPLLQADPKNPLFRDLSAQLDAKVGRTTQAIATYRTLATENPTTPTPFLGILRIIEAKRAANQKFSLEDYHFALSGIMRIERDPKRRAVLQKDLDTLEHAMAAPKTPRDPNRLPSDAEIMAVFERGTLEQRRQGMLYVLTRKEEPSPAVMKAVMRRIAARTESDPACRVVAVRTLGRRGGTSMIPLIRLALRDTNEHVRSEAADTLTRIAERDGRISRSVMLILGRHALARGIEFPAAVRLHILRLAGAHLDVDEKSTDGEHRDAFRTWWRSARVEDLVIQGLDGYDRLGDRFAEQIVGPFVRSPSFLVFRSAWRALEAHRVAMLADGGAKAGTAARATWLRAMPRYVESACVLAKHKSLRAALEDWLARTPK